VILTEADMQINGYPIKSKIFFSPFALHWALLYIFSYPDFWAIIDGYTGCPVLI
jgi:hypothetical protein